MNFQLLENINLSQIDEDVPQECIKRTELAIKELQLVFVNNEKLQKQERIIIGLCGGSGSGKSVMADLLCKLFNGAGLKTIIMTGDNVPRRIPRLNDSERLTLFRSAGTKALVSLGLYTEEVREKLDCWMKDFTDASYDYVKENPWFEHYLAAGKNALENYLGSPLEQDFDYCNEILESFKQGKNQVWLKNLGREEDSLCYEKVYFSDKDIMILEWTHANSDFVKGVDIPIFLESTVEETLEYRLQRNRDTHIDSPFLMMVLRIEQDQLIAQKPKALIKIRRFQLWI